MQTFDFTNEPHRPIVVRYSETEWNDIQEALRYYSITCQLGGHDDKADRLTDLLNRRVQKREIQERIRNA